MDGWMVVIDIWNRHLGWTVGMDGWDRQLGWTFGMDGWDGRLGWNADWTDEAEWTDIFLLYFHDSGKCIWAKNGAMLLGTPVFNRSDLRIYPGFKYVLRL